MNIWYDLGGKSICTSDVTDNVRLTEGYEDEIRSLPMIGPVYSVDMESIIGHEPDLIISQVGTQSTQASKLRIWAIMLFRPISEGSLMFWIHTVHLVKFWVRASC